MMALGTGMVPEALGGRGFDPERGSLCTFRGRVPPLRSCRPGLSPDPCNPDTAGGTGRRSGVRVPGLWAQAPSQAAALGSEPSTHRNQLRLHSQRARRAPGLPSQAPALPRGPRCTCLVASGPHRPEGLPVSPEGQAPTSPGHRGRPTTAATEEIALCHCDTGRRADGPAVPGHGCTHRGRALAAGVREARSRPPGCGHSRPARRMRSVHRGPPPCRAEALGRPTPPKHAAERPQRLRAHGSVRGRGPEQARPGDGTEQRCPGREAGRGDCGGDGVPFGARDKALDPDGGTSAQLRECATCHRRVRFLVVKMIHLCYVYFTVIKKISP